MSLHWFLGLSETTRLNPFKGKITESFFCIVYCYYIVGADCEWLQRDKSESKNTHYQTELLVWLLLPCHPGNDEVPEILTAAELTGRVVFKLKVQRCVPLFGWRARVLLGSNRAKLNETHFFFFFFRWTVRGIGCPKLLKREIKTINFAVREKKNGLYKWAEE